MGRWLSLAALLALGALLLGLAGQVRRLATAPTDGPSLAFDDADDPPDDALPGPASAQALPEVLPGPGQASPPVEVPRRPGRLCPSEIFHPPIA